MPADEIVDILVPPSFEPGGEICTRAEAVRDGHWIGVINLWIAQSVPENVVIYQVRSFDSPWCPGKLDTSVGGHLGAGETAVDALRESEEEIGRSYEEGEIMFIGNRLNVSAETDGGLRHSVIRIGITEDNIPLTDFVLDPREVYGIVAIPVEKLIALWEDAIEEFKVKILLADGSYTSYVVTKDSFPFNWDHYHYKMALHIRDYLAGKKNIVY